MPPTIEQSINEEMKKFEKEKRDVTLTHVSHLCIPVSWVEYFLRSSLLRISKQSKEDTLTEVRKMAEGMKKDIRSTTGNVLTDSIHNSTLNTLITNLPK